ncbi:MAG: hypothetical protein AABY18_00060 [Candidatus Thermoplasmatota archaeon]
MTRAITSPALDDYLDALKPQLRHLPFSDQRKVLAQVREHLQEDIQARLEEDRKLSVDEAAMHAAHNFGEPEDIGVAYGASGGVVRKSTGEVLIHFAILTGRGVARTLGKTVKWTGIALAFLLLLGGIIFLALAVVYQPTIEKGLEEATSYSTRVLVERTGMHDGDTATFRDSFSITDRTLTSDFQLRVTPGGGNTGGCMAIVITGPGDSKVYDSTGNCEVQAFRTSFTVAGTYSIEYRLVAFSGTFSVSGTATERVDEAP